MRDVIGAVRARGEQLGLRITGLPMRQQKLNQFEPDSPPGLGGIWRPRCVQRIMVEPECLGHVLTVARDPGELQVDRGIFGRRLAQRQQDRARRIAVSLDRQRSRERNTVDLVIATLDVGPAKSGNRVVDPAALEFLLAPPVPLGGGAQAALAIIDGNRSGEEEGGDGDHRKRNKLKHLAVDDREAVWDELA